MNDTGFRFDGPFARIQALIGWAVLALCLLAVIPQGGNQPVVWTLLSFAILPLFALCMLLSLFRPIATALGRAVPVLLLYLAVLFWGAIQTELSVPSAFAHPVWADLPENAAARISADPEQGRHIVMRLATYGMIAWVLAASALNTIRAWNYVRAIALFSSALAAYGLYAALTGYNPVLGLNDGPTVVSATFVNRNSYATYGAFGLFANVAVYISQAGRGESDDDRVALRNFLENFFGGAWLYALGALICGAAIMLTASRAGIGSAFVGLVVLLVCLARRKRIANYLVWGMVVLIVGFVASTLSANLIGRLVFLAATGEEPRFTIYPALFQELWDRPWLGQGVGAFQDAFRPHVPPAVANFDWDLAHNSYLENFYELGIPGAAVLYLTLGLIVLRLLVGVRTRETDVGLPALALAVATTAALHSTLDFSLQMPACAALFAALMGLGWSQSFRRKDRASLQAGES